MSHKTFLEMLERRWQSALTDIRETSVIVVDSIFKGLVWSIRRFPERAFNDT
jgi:hypothetical protein